jgi:Ca2+-binding RTX toxin-like protein
MTDDGQSFLGRIPADGPITVRSITPSFTGDGVPGTIELSGADDPDNFEAVVLDVSNLPSGTVINLSDVDYISIVGGLTITGGPGNNQAAGDSSAQIIVLGPGDDILSGGGGDDQVSSAGGNDRLFGDSGNDTLSGGDGDDQLTGGDGDDSLEGGAGRDVAMFAQTFFDATIDGARTGGSVTGQGTDSLQGGVEILTFSDNRTTVTKPETPFAVEPGGRAVIDEAFYLEINTDVAQAVENGVFASGAQHFRFHGFEEGRDPNALFDQAYYLDTNADVAAAVDEGVFQTAYDHYRQFGAREGRAASEYFDTQAYLEENEDVAAAADFINGLDHFLLFGVDEGRTGFLVDL